MRGVQQPYFEVAPQLRIAENAVAVDLVFQRGFLKSLGRWVVVKHFQQIVGAEFTDRRLRRMRDLKIGLDAFDVFGPDQIQRTLTGCQFHSQLRTRQRPIAGGEPTARDLGARRGRIILPGLQHQVERHRQPRREHVLAGFITCLHICPRQAVDQPDLAAICAGDIGAVHPIDDARQHKARAGRI